MGVTIHQAAGLSGSSSEVPYTQEFAYGAKYQRATDTVTLPNATRSTGGEAKEAQVTAATASLLLSSPNNNSPSNASSNHNIILITYIRDQRVARLLLISENTHDTRGCKSKGILILNVLLLLNFRSFGSIFQICKTLNFSKYSQ